MNNENSDSILTTLVGIVIGMIAMLLLQTATGMTPRQLDREWEQQAIQRGYAHYEIGTDRAVRFIWNEPAKRP